MSQSVLKALREQQAENRRRQAVGIEVLILSSDDTTTVAVKTGPALRERAVDYNWTIQTKSPSIKSVKGHADEDGVTVTVDGKVEVRHEANTKNGSDPKVRVIMTAEGCSNQRPVITVYTPERHHADVTRLTVETTKAQPSEQELTEAEINAARGGIRELIESLAGGGLFGGGESPFGSVESGVMMLDIPEEVRQQGPEATEQYVRTQMEQRLGGRVVMPEGGLFGDEDVSAIFGNGGPGRRRERTHS